jgi:hypothetical protein
VAVFQNPADVCITACQEYKKQQRQKQDSQYEKGISHVLKTPHIQ